MKKKNNEFSYVEYYPETREVYKVYENARFRAVKTRFAIGEFVKLIQDHKLMMINVLSDNKTITYAIIENTAV